MNRDWVLLHLREAQEELVTIVNELESSQDYDEADFMVAMAHLYNHINTAWNSRNAELDETSIKTNFYLWRDFPNDISMG